MKSSKIIGTTPFSTVENITELETSFLNQEYEKALSRLKPVYYERVPIKTSSGQLFFNSGWIIPLLKDNAFDGMICTLRDTTLAQNLSDLLYQTLEQCPDGIGVIQQDSPNYIPKAYFANKAFFQIFGLSEIIPVPDTVPFIEVVEMMKKKIENGSEWEKLENEAFHSHHGEVECALQMKNGDEYQWVSKPLVNEHNNRHIGRFATVKKVNFVKEKKAKGKKK